jgi:hypothetical protein
MNTNRTLPVPNPDFDSLKTSLKDFMKSYDGLSDYNFDGSTISILLDTLSYNSHLNAFWLNMIANEAFIKTAVKRNNVVSAARDLGYTPSNASSAMTELYLELEPTQVATSSTTLPAGTTFTSSTNNTSYSFNLLDDITIDYNYEKGLYIADNVKVYEGRLLVHEWEVAAENELGKPNLVKDVTLTGISLPNQNVDSKLLKVYVQDDIISSNYVKFNPYSDGLSIKKNSLTYFVSEDELGLVNITFGDGVIGYKPSIGSKIKVVYLVSSGPGPNGVATFNQSSGTETGTVTTCISKYPAAGGAFAEDIASIKYNAQLNYESQGKAVVTGDYEYLVRNAYPNAKKVITWGGQDNVPPQFGKVFISIQPKEGLTITTKEKFEILEKISKKNIATVNPIIVDPEEIYIDLIVTINYIPDNEISSGALERIVSDNIRTYADNTLNMFDKNLEYSRLLTNIDDSSKYITSNITDILLSKRLNVYNNKQKEFSLNYGNALVPGSINSSAFSYSSYESCFFSTSGNKLQIVTDIIENQELRRITVVTDAGTVDYETGSISLKVLPITPNKSYFDNIKNNYYVKIFAKPASNNVMARRNQILQIDNIKILQKRLV